MDGISALEQLLVDDQGRPPLPPKVVGALWGLIAETRRLRALEHDALAPGGGEVTLHGLTMNQLLLQNKKLHRRCQAAEGRQLDRCRQYFLREQELRNSQLTRTRDMLLVIQGLHQSVRKLWSDHRHRPSTFWQRLRWLITGKFE